MDTTITPGDHAVTVQLSERERAIYERLAQERRMTVDQLLRLAVATYEEVEMYRKEGGRFPLSRRGEPRGCGVIE